MSFLTSYNLPLLSIPAYYALAVFPHGYAISTANNGDMAKHDNRNPSSSNQIERLRKTLPSKQFAAYERAERCHQNHMENMPLFVASVFAGLLAQRNGTLGGGLVDTFCILWMVVRIAYTIAYIRTETQSWSYLRSLLYFIATGLCFWMLAISAKALV